VRLWDNFFWPAFNVADSAITVGAISLVIIALIKMRKKDEPEPKPGNTNV